MFLDPRILLCFTTAVLSQSSAVTAFAPQHHVGGRSKNHIGASFLKPRHDTLGHPATPEFQTICGSTSRRPSSMLSSFDDNAKSSLLASPIDDDTKTMKEIFASSGIMALAEIAGNDHSVSGILQASMQKSSKGLSPFMLNGVGKDDLDMVEKITGVGLNGLDQCDALVVKPETDGGYTFYTLHSIQEEPVPEKDDEVTVLAPDLSEDQIKEIERLVKEGKMSKSLISADDASKGTTRTPTSAKEDRAAQFAETVISMWENTEAGAEKPSTLKSKSSSDENPVKTFRQVHDWPITVGSNGQSCRAVMTHQIDLMKTKAENGDYQYVSNIFKGGIDPNMTHNKKKIREWSLASFSIDLKEPSGFHPVDFSPTNTNKQKTVTTSVGVAVGLDIGGNSNGEANGSITGKFDYSHSETKTITDWAVLLEGFSKWTWYQATPWDGRKTKPKKPVYGWFDILVKELPELSTSTMDFSSASIMSSKNVRKDKVRFEFVRDIQFHSVYVKGLDAFPRGYRPTKRLYGLTVNMNAAS